MSGVRPAVSRRTALVLLALAGVGGLAAWQGRAPVPLVDTDEVCVVAPPTPYDPASGLALHAPRPVPPEARCPVCGMFPARSRPWAAQVIFQDGATQFFDSPLSLYVYLQSVSRYTPGRQAHDIAASFVTDTPSGDWTPAAQAFYVSGSNALGPMRAGNLPAFGSRAAAQAFATQRGGEVLVAGQIHGDLLQRLNGDKVHAHRNTPESQ